MFTGIYFFAYISDQISEQNTLNLKQNVFLQAHY